MNIEDLKKLKQQLESQQKFVLVRWLDISNINGMNIPYEASTMQEYMKFTHTDGAYKACKDYLIEETVKKLTKKGIPFDTVVIGLDVRLLCEENFINNVKALINNGKVDYIAFKEITKQLKFKTSHDYVELRFWLSLFETGIKKGVSLYDYCMACGIDTSDFSLYNFRGIVHLGEFIELMNNDGYEIKLSNGKNCRSVEDYINATIKDVRGDYMHITCDLREKKETKKETEKEKKLGSK